MAEAVSDPCEGFEPLFPDWPNPRPLSEVNPLELLTCKELVELWRELYNNDDSAYVLNRVLPEVRVQIRSRRVEGAEPDYSLMSTESTIDLAEMELLERPYDEGQTADSKYSSESCVGSYGELPCRLVCQKYNSPIQLELIP